MFPSAQWMVRSVAVASACFLVGGRSGQAAEDPLSLVRQLNEAFVRVAETVSPSVVVVRVQPRPDAEGGFDHGLMFRFLPEEMQKEMEKRMEQERERRSQRPLPPDYYPEQGSGVIFREDGYILTSGHVVENAGRVQVRLLDGRRYPAEVRGVDAESDLAVLKVEASGLPAARFGNSSRVRVGEFAVAIGAPFELDYTVTYGHVSAKGRRLMADTVMMDQDFLQTDANINRGNSGGPLINIDGEVIGINAMIRGENTGIAFAVPVDLAKEVADQLIQHGKFTRAWLGIGIQTVGEVPGRTPEDLPVSQGVVVTEILENGPSWDSELKARDVIVSVDQVPVRDVAELKRQVSRKPAGRPLDVEVYRGGRKLDLRLVPGELPDNRLASMRRGQRGQPTESAPETESASESGLSVGELDAEAAERVGLERGEGVLVVEVRAGSPAAERGITPGDVITKINRRPVRGLLEFADAIQDADLERGMAVTVYGPGGRRFEILKQAGE